jgi:predicted DNA-binding transcriptional regulator AlpA
MNRQTHNPTDAPSPLLLDARGVGRLLSLSRASIYTMHNSGRLPRPLRPTGSDPRWRADELRAWIESDCPTREAWEASKAARR